jgi:hypothetical protein
MRLVPFAAPTLPLLTSINTTHRTLAPRSTYTITASSASTLEPKGREGLGFTSRSDQDSLGQSSMFQGSSNFEVNGGKYVYANGNEGFFNWYYFLFLRIR